MVSSFGFCILNAIAHERKQKEEMRPKPAGYAVVSACQHGIAIIIIEQWRS